MARLNFIIGAILGLAGLLGAASAIAQESAPAAEPNRTDGKAVWLLNTQFAKIWSHENALINRAAYLTGDLEERNDGTLLMGLVRTPVDGSGDYYHGEYVLEWEGSADLDLYFQRGRLNKDGKNRKIETYALKPNNTAISSFSYKFDKVAYYRAEHEAAFKAGEVFSPEFVTLASRYKVLRTLDWMPVNGSHLNRTDKLRAGDAHYWGGQVPIEAQFDLAVKAGMALWIPFPAMIGAPDAIVDEASSLEGHWKAKQDRERELFKMAFEPALASDEWDKLATRIVAAMEASGYPQNQTFYLELGNEPWASHFVNGVYFWSLTEALMEKTGKKFSGQFMAAYGYFSARFAESFAKALHEAGRDDQAWKMVINSQTVWHDQTKGALQGVSTYKGGSFKQPMSRFGVAVTGYYSGGFHWTRNNTLFGRSMSRAAWIAEWRKRFEANPDALAGYITDYLTRSTPGDQNIEKIIADQKAHQAIAKQFGATFIGEYEGGDHDNLDGELKNVPGVRDFARSWLRSGHRARVIRYYAKRMDEEFPDTIRANYQHTGPSYNPDKPWVTAPLWDQDAPQAKAMLELLRAPRH